MTVVVTETRSAWQGRPPFHHCTCDHCGRTMSFHRPETAEQWRQRHEAECVKEHAHA